MEIRHLFIINPIAGGTDSTERLRPQIEAGAAELGQRYTILNTTCKEHAIRLARDTVLAEPDVDWRVYACGGDGTFMETATGLAGIKNAALTCVPCGTGNDFIRIFKKPDEFRDIKGLMRGDIHELDLIEADITAPDGTHTLRHSVNICSAGLDSRIAADMRSFHWARHMGSGVPYNISLVYNFIRGLHQPYKIVCGDEVLEENFTLITICNGRFYGGGSYVMPYSEPDDGVLEFLFIRKTGRLNAAGLVKKYCSGSFEKLGDLVIYRRGRKVEIICGKDQHINVDGESIWAKSVVFSLSEHKVKYIAPPGACYRQAVHGNSFSLEKTLV